MMRKIVSILLIFLLLASLVPQGVFAAETEMLTITEEEKLQSRTRTSRLDLRDMESTSNAAEGWTWDSENSILTLDNVNFVVGDSVYAIRMNSGTIVLKGNNTVTCTYDDGREDKGISVSVVGAIYASNKNLIFEGPGSLNVSSTAYGGKGIYTWRGNVTVNGGTITATGGTSIRRNGSSCGIVCGSLTVNGGSFTAIGRNSSGQSVGIDTYPGGLKVNGGTVRASSGSAQNEAGFNMPSSAIIARSIDIGSSSITEPFGAYITSYKDDNATMQIIASPSGETATNVVISGDKPIESPSTTPETMSLYPANGATNVGCTAANPPIFQVTFDREIAARGDEEYQANVNLTASQPFAIYRAEDNALVYKPTQYSWSDFLIAYTSEKSTLSVTPVNRHILLDPGTEYYITMGAGFVTFADGTKSPAITKGQWSFTTEGEKEEPEEEKLNFSISRTSVSLLPGQTANPRITLTPSDAKVSWTSSRSSVARVSSDGTITGVAPGTATITGAATLGNQKKTVTCAVTVNQNLLFGWTKKAANLKVGDLESLSFTYQPSDAHISITSSNPSAIRVEGSQYSKGSGYTTIRAVGGGSSTVTARITANGQEKTATVTINVASDAEEIAQRFVDEALKYVGMNEQRFENTVGSLVPDGQWCAAFVSECAKKAGVHNVIPYETGAGTIINSTITAGGTGFRFNSTDQKWYPKTSVVDRSQFRPQKGDIVALRLKGSSGTTHCGIVYDVTDSNVLIVHGNWNGRVATSSFTYESLKYTSPTYGPREMLIVAYARPDWSAATGIISGTRNGEMNCPVDVQVSYNGEVLDSATGQLSASFGTMTVTGEGDDRSVSLNLNDYYDVGTWINGTGTGTMTFTTTSKDEDGTVGTRTFRNVPITPSTLIHVVQSGTAQDAVTLEIYANGGDSVTSVWYADCDTPSVSSANSELTEWYLSDTSEPTDSLPFTDVKLTDWFYSAVQYVYEYNIMTGTSATTFAPNGTVERSQVVQMLYNLEGQPTVTGSTAFTDVDTDEWYGKAVLWAERTGVVDGYENNTFRPGKAVSREEFAQMLYNYAKYKHYDLSATADLSDFPDGGSVSSWANSAMAWANGNGLINGHDDGRLDPGGTAIRAQAASILMNFDLNLVK